MSLKLISLNIERDRHLNRVIPFLQSARPDVLCLQEVCQKDVPLFQKLMGGQYRFSRARRDSESEGGNINGEAIFSRLPVRDWFYARYAGPEEDTVFDTSSQETRTHTAIRAVTGCEIKHGTSVYRIATTHFTWTPHGEPDNYQRQDVRRMLDAIMPLGELILCGDFNAPRGGEIFSFINDHYHDAIPLHYKTSIDIGLHREGKNKPEELSDKMVDGLFMTHGYKASGVRLESGVSDHMAIIAKINITGSRRITDVWNLLRW